jgi:hypothetical protein
MVTKTLSAREARRSAAVALRLMGASGRVHLRQALGDEDPFAADMARHVLDLPTDEDV